MVLTTFIDLFLPRLCPVCKEKLPTAERFICSSCFLSLNRAADEKISYEFGKSFRNEGYVTDFTSLFLFEKDKPVQDVIHAVKYGKKFKLGIYLGEKGAEIKADVINNWNIDIIVPIPLHKLKKIERGFNQSEYIVKGFAAAIGKPAGKGIVKRVKYTQSQTTLKVKDRKDNMHKAFVVKNRALIKGKNILLMDDVCTTGTTINECAKVLLKNGASKVYAFTIALA